MGKNMSYKKDKGKDSKSKDESLASKTQQAYSDASRGTATDAVPKEKGREAKTKFDEAKFQKGSNSPEYYKRSGNLADIASVVYDNTRLGDSLRRVSNFDIAGETSIPATRNSTQHAAPGMMAIDVVLNPGICDPETGRRSGITQAVDACFAMMRQFQTGSVNYGKGDLFAYALAMYEAYAFHASLVRALGALRFYNPMNTYTARSIVEGLGFNYDDLVTNTANYVEIINNFALALAQYCVPSMFAVGAKWYELMSYMYADNKSLKPQVYAFRMHGIHILDVTGEDTVLKYKTMYSYRGFNKTLSRDNINQIINEILLSLTNNTDVHIMSGDFLRAYGLGNLMHAPLVDTKYVVAPIENVEMLTMIENMHWITAGGTLNSDLNAGTMDIRVDNEHGEYLRFTPVIRFEWQQDIKDQTMSRSIACVNPFSFLNFRNPNPTSDQIIIATRLRPICKLTNHSTSPLWWGVTVESCDTVLPVEVSIFTDPDSGSTYGEEPTRVVVPRVYQSNNNAFNATLGRLATIMSNFNWAPFFTSAYYWDLNDAVQWDIEDPIGELDNYVAWDNSQQQRLDDICLLSEFWVPGVSSITSSGKKV